MRRPLFVVCLCLMAAALLWLQLRPPTRMQAVVEKAAKKEVAEGDYLTVTGQVYRKETRISYGREIQIIYIQSVIFHESNNNLILSKETQSQFSYNLICEIENSLREDITPSNTPLPEIGETLVIAGSFAYFPEASNPGEFDLAQYYRISGIGGKLKKAQILYGDGNGNALKEGLNRIREYFSERLYRCFPGQEASILTAMLLGEKSSLDEEIKELYKRNGILHILSISGLHISILGLGFYKLLRKAGIPLYPAAVCGAILLILYGVMTGMAISACRAIGMYLIRMLGECLGRTYDMLTALGIMGVIMVAGEPEYLYHSGFLLSFGSVCGIGVLLPALQPKKGSHGKELLKILKYRLSQSILSGLSVTLFTLPIHLWFYYEIPVYSVLLNVAVLPFMGVVMVIGMTIMLLPGMSFLAVIDRWILYGYEWLCTLFDELPFHTWSPGQPKLWQILVYYLLLGILAAALKRRHSIWKTAVLTIAVIVLGLRFPEGMTVTFLDVGQGDCILLQTAEGEVYLFDAGSSSKSQIAKYILLPYLKQQGITYIDAVFLSHPDSDHTSGVYELLLMEKSGISMGALVLPGIEEEARREEFEDVFRTLQNSVSKTKIPILYISAGYTWNSGAAVFTCLHPGEGYPAEEKNAYSQCFLIEYGSFSLLLTGDVEGEGERQLKEKLVAQGVGEVSVLKVAHHGSRFSTGEDLLDLINPKAAVISCGQGNSYGHPHEEVLKRLLEKETMILMTPEAGAVWLNVSKEGVRVHWFNE